MLIKLASNWLSWASWPSDAAVFEPGWRWSEHVKPIVGTDSCQEHHIGYRFEGSRSMPPHAFLAWRSRAKSWSRPPSAICYPALGWHLQTEVNSNYAASTGAVAWRHWFGRHCRNSLASTERW